MNRITLIMADKPADAEAHAISIWVRNTPFLHVRWPEIGDYQPVSNAALLAQCDDWVRRAAEREIHVVTHSPLVVNRLRRRVAEGVLPADALRIVLVGSDGPRTLDVNEYGTIPTWPDGWCDADARESEAIIRAALARHKAEKTNR